VPTIVAGDFNVAWIRGEQKAAITSAGFSPTAGTPPLPKGKEATSAPKGRCSVTDHILCNDGLTFADARYVAEAGGFQLAGTTGALSDHAAVLARCSANRALDGALEC
jgi:hypothetical protein